MQRRSSSVLQRDTFFATKLSKEGDYKVVDKNAEAENIRQSYLSRVLRMTLLAPEIVEAILAGRQPDGLTMTRAMQPFPLEWVRQRFP